MTNNPQSPDFISGQSAGDEQILTPPLSDEAKRAIDELAEEIAKKRCILFLGNDLRLGYPKSAPPCREELAEALAAELRPAWQVEFRLPVVAEAYETQFSSNRLIRKVRQLVDQPHYEPAWLHRKVAELPVEGYVTMAYDQLLEKALCERGRSAFNIVDDPDVSFEGTAEVSIAKLHGDINRPDSLVLTESDYCQLPHKVERKLQTIQHYFNVKTVLIVGYELDDEHFKQIYFAVKAKTGRFGQALYAVYPGCPPETQGFWAKQEMKILDADPRQFLGHLSAEVKARQKAAQEKAQEPEEFTLLNKPPYKYLDAYTEQDQDIFCGRDSDALLVWGKILSFRTTMLFGASGTGKTSLLQAGVAPRLGRTGYRTALVRLLGDPLEEVMRAVQKARDGEATALPVDLRDLFRSLPETERWVICLDQFEEFFVRQPPDERARFRDQVAACSRDEERDVRFVFSLREDFVGQMQELRAAMPDLWTNSHRLMSLSRSEAALAVIHPAARAGLHYEPGLVETLLEEVSEKGSVAPPNLQIVCNHLYKQVAAQNPEEAQAQVAEWRAQHPDFDPRYPTRQTVTVAHYRESGGAHAILRGYLDRALASLVPNENSLARKRLQDILRALVEYRETSNTKAVLTAAQVAERANVPLPETEANLKKLASSDYRLVRSLHEGRQYELAHECLILAIEAWPESPQRRKVRDIKGVLRKHLELGSLLSRSLLEMIWEERDNPELHLTPDELKLLVRSSSEVGGAERARKGLRSE